MDNSVFDFKLKAEVSVLSPRVAFLDHQRLILNVDNSALKQRIAALAQDKIFKDGNFFFNYKRFLRTHTNIYIGIARTYHVLTM